jgi:hypothetical protein
MRRPAVLLGVVFLLAGILAMPAAAGPPTNLDGPAPAIWLADPDGIGEGDIATGDPIAGASGSAKVNSNGATIKVKATGLTPGHTYTMWVVYFSDQTLCEDRGSRVEGCNGEDLSFVAGGGVLFGNGQVAGGNGKATFTARLNTGDTAGPPPPPPPFAFAPYEAGEDNEFHVVIRSHGPKIPGQVGEQIHEFNGGCVDQVGPLPEQTGNFPVPVEPGECGDVQLYIFS